MKSKYIVKLRKESVSIKVSTNTIEKLQEELKLIIQSTDKEITISSAKTTDVNNLYKLKSDLIEADFDNFKEMVMEFVELTTSGHEDLKIWALN